MTHITPQPEQAADQLDNVMIDTETLGTKPGAAVLSIGAVMFDQFGLGGTFYAPVLLEILEAAFEACGLAAPWAYWNVRDTRTLYDLAGVKVDRAAGTHHNALDDAVNQARAAVQAMGILQARVEEAV